MKEKYLITNFFGKQQSLHYPKNSIARERISLSENGEIVKTVKEAPEVLTIFLGNIVKNLNIFQYSDFDPIIENAEDPSLKGILK